MEKSPTMAIVFWDQQLSEDPKVFNQEFCHREDHPSCEFQLVHQELMTSFIF